MAEGLTGGGSSGSKATNQKDLNEELWYACSDGDIPLVKEKIAKGADLSYIGQGGKTPLAIAAYMDYAELVEVLMKEYHADPEICDEQGCSPLYWACGQECVSAVKALLKCGAKVDSLTKNGATPFMVTCNVGSREILQCLISYGAYRHIVYKELTGKLLAEKEEHQNVVEYLSEVDKYDNVLQRSSDKPIKIEFTKYSIHGAAGSGKTCLQHLLLCEDPPVRESTNISTPAVIGSRDMKTTIMAAGPGAVPDKNSGDSGIKRIDDDKKYIEIMAKQAKSELPVESSDQRPEGATPLGLVPASGGKLKKGFKKIFCHKQKRNKDNPKPSQKKKPFTERDTVEFDSSEHDHSQPPQPDSIVSCGMLSILPSTSSDTEFTLRWVYGSDSGGQPAFQDIAPAFIRRCSPVVLTLKLNERLCDYPNMEYVHKGHFVKHAGRKQLTNLQMILSLARSLSSIQRRNSGDHTPCPTPYPKLIIIGTFYDEIQSCSETLEEKNRILKEKLKPFAKCLILTDKGNPIHSIYTLVKHGEGREEESKRICDYVLNSKQTLEVPLSRLMFQFELLVYAESKSGDKDVLRIEECLEMGHKVRINDEGSVREALKDLDSLGIILYFHEILPDIVFVKPQVLLSCLSNLVSLMTFEEEIFPEYTNDLTAKDRHYLRKNACFNRRILETIFSKCENSIFTANNFIELMKHLLVITEINGGSDGPMYFLPCALQWKDFTEYELEWLMKSDPAPILLYWEETVSKSMSLIPYGLFLGTINALLLFDDPDLGFKLQTSAFGSSSDFTNRRNAVFLNLTNGCLLLIDKTTHIELRYKGPEPDTYCPKILAAVKFCMGNTADKYSYNPDIQTKINEGFMASCKDQQDEHVFKVSISARNLQDNGDHLYQGTCWDHYNTVPLTGAQRKWFESNIESINLGVLPTDRRLTVNDLLPCLRPIWPYWRTLGVYLGLEWHIIRAIEVDRVGQRAEICFSDMIDEWLKNDKDCTTEKLAKALTEMKFKISR